MVERDDKTKSMTTTRGPYWEPIVSNIRQVSVAKNILSLRSPNIKIKCFHWSTWQAFGSGGEGSCWICCWLSTISFLHKKRAITGGCCRHHTLIKLEITVNCLCFLCFNWSWHKGLCCATWKILQLWNIYVSVLVTFWNKFSRRKEWQNAQAFLFDKTERFCAEVPGKQCCVCKIHLTYILTILKKNFCGSHLWLILKERNSHLSRKQRSVEHPSSLWGMKTQSNQLSLLLKIKMSPSVKSILGLRYSELVLQVTPSLGSQLDLYQFHPPSPVKFPQHPHSPPKPPYKRLFSGWYDSNTVVPLLPFIAVALLYNRCLFFTFYFSLHVGYCTIELCKAIRSHDSLSSHAAGTLLYTPNNPSNYLNPNYPFFPNPKVPTFPEKRGSHPTHIVVAPSTQVMDSASI